MSASEPLVDADPRQIGPYRLLGRLGAGGMGQVYLGTGPAGPVAVKVVHHWLAADDEFRARFAREVATSRRVAGPWTAAVVDADTDGPLPWLASEYVHGVVLDRAVAGAGPLPAVSVHLLAADLARALAAVHRTGLVHRDVKPGNVVLTADRPYLIDFGISRALDGTRLTGTGAVMGTPAFMAPEQVAGEPAQTASDLFALGSVLVWAATGVGPFGDGSPLAVLRRVRVAEPDLGGLTAPVRELVAGCLRRDPAARPGAAELAELLEPVPVTPRHGWLPPAVTALIGPPPPALAPAAPVTPVTPVVPSPRAAAPTTPDDPDALTERVPPPAPPPAPPAPPAVPPADPARWFSRRRLLLGAGALAVVGAGAGIGLAVRGSAPPAAAPPRAAAPRRAWSTRLQGGIRTLVLDGAGSVYAAGLAGQLHRLSLDTGRPQWTFTLRGPVLSTPVPTGDRVAVDDGSHVYVVDARQGSLVQEFDLASLVGASPDAVVVRVTDEAGDPVLQGRELPGGAIRWTAPAPAPAPQRAERPIAAVGGVLARVVGSSLIGIDVLTGQTRWRSDVGTGGTRPSAVPQPLDDTSITTVPAPSEERIVALDPVSGQLRWHTGTRYGGTRAVVDGGGIYLADGGLVRCLDLTTGQERWSRTDDYGGDQPTWGLGSTVAAAADGTCYVGGSETVYGEDGGLLTDATGAHQQRFHLFALNGETGETRWFLPVEGEYEWDTPLVASGRTVVLGTEDGTVHAVVDE